MTPEEEQEKKTKQIIKSRNDEHVARKFLNVLESARARNIEFGLELKDVRRLLSSEKCYYTKTKFSRGINSLNRRSIDRVDNTKGYVPGNVVACTVRINKLKNDLTVDEIKQLYQGLKNKKII